MSYVSTYSQWKMSLTWNKHYNFLIKRVSFTILPWRWWTPTWSTMGWDIFLVTDMCLVRWSLLFLWYWWWWCWWQCWRIYSMQKINQMKSNEFISAWTSFKEAQGRENGQCDALSWLQGGVLSNLTYMNAIFPIFDVAANIAHSDFYFSILSITIWLWHQQKGQKVTLFVI